MRKKKNEKKKKFRARVKGNEPPLTVSASISSDQGRQYGQQEDSSQHDGSKKNPLADGKNRYARTDFTLLGA
jgi:hypothetical protein